MKENTFLKLALVWSLIGIFILLVVAVFTEPKAIELAEVGQHIGEKVIVQGVVGDATYKEKVSFIDLDDGSGKISIVLFENPEKKVYTGDEIQVKGQVKEYEGDLEIVADEIVCVKCNV